MTMIYVVPASGGRVRQPERNGRVMPVDGAYVPDDDYYQRLLISGDVSPGAPPTKAAPAPEAPPKTATETGRGARRGTSASEG